jgi:hypothetical protein
MMKQLRNIFFLLLLAASLPLAAQTNMLGTTNVPHNIQFNWKHITTKTFDIHYYSDDPVMAGLAGKMAEEALWEICKRFDYKNKTRFALFLFLSPNDLAHSNSYPVPNLKDNGITPLQTGSSNVLFPGNYSDFREQVRSAVAKLLIDDYYFGGPIQFSIQNTVLMYLPEWYTEGFPAFLGEGWDYEDEFWLAGLNKADLQTLAVEGDGPIQRTARKSIWYFISQKIGPDKLGEIFYMTRLTRSVEDGIVQVLGLNLKSLTDQWREFVVQRIHDNSTFRESIAEQSELVDLGNNDEILSFALNPRQPKVAVYVEKNGKQNVVIYNAETGRVRETPIAGGFPTEQFATMRYEFPMAWSPDGNQLVTTVFDKENEYLAWYDMTKGSAKFVNFKPGLSRIYQIAWSPDGTQLVCSGLHQGQIDLYRFVPGSGSFVQLTNDLNDDLFPVWNAEGTLIYHASTRKTADSGHDIARFDVNHEGFDVWAFNLAEGSLSQVTRSPGMNEYPVGMLSSFELLVRSDQTGILNLEKINVFLGDSTYMTNTPIGMYRAAISDSLLAYASTSMGSLEIYVTQQNEVLREQVATRAMLRQYNDKAASLAKLKKDAAARMDSIRQIPFVQPIPVDTATNGSKEPADSAGTGEKPVKYYVFDDDDDDKPQPKRRIKKNNADYLLKKEPEKPDFNETEVGGPNRTRTVWVADRVSARFSYDPIYKLSILGEARLRDQQGNQQLAIGFRPYIDFRSSDTYLRYTNMKHVLDWQVGLSRSGRFLNKNDFAARYSWTRLDGAVVRPLNRYLSVGVGAHTALIERKNIELLVPKGIDGHAFMVGGRLNLTYDKTEDNGNFITKGTFATVDVGNAYSLSDATNNFITSRFDLREYLPVKRCVLAGRLSGAWSQGPMQQRFFLGGTNEWLLSKWNNPSDYPIESPNLPALHYMEYITPIRGFQFNGRNGTKYFAANAELRIPVSRIFLKQLNTNPAYNIEIIPFFDIGSTWTQGNPLSQKNPIDTETIDVYPLTITVQTLKSPFLMGFGAGTRMQLFGYSMRADLAWGVDDYTILSPRLHLSLGKNF